MALKIDEPAELHLRRDLGFFELGFRNQPGLISTIRRFVAAFFARLIVDDGIVERVALTVHELLEAVAEFSTDGELWIRVEVLQPGMQVRVSVRANHRSNMDALRQMLEEIGGGGDPNEAYQTAMRVCLQGGDGSRMRLARVRAEANMNVSVEAGGDGELTVIATTEMATSTEP